MGITENVIALLGKIVIEKKPEEGDELVELSPEDETDVVCPWDEDDVTDHEVVEPAAVLLA